jgi:hypothetical protein
MWERGVCEPGGHLCALGVGFLPGSVSSRTDKVCLGLASVVGHGLRSPVRTSRQVTPTSLHAYHTHALHEPVYTQFCLKKNCGGDLGSAQA